MVLRPDDLQIPDRSYSPANEGSFRPIKLLTTEGTVFHAEGAIGAGLLISRRKSRVYDLLWRWPCPPMRRTARRRAFRPRSRHLHRRHPPPTRGASTRSSSRRSAAGAPAAAATANSGIFSGFHARRTTARPRFPRRATACFVDRNGAEHRTRRRRRVYRRPRHRDGFYRIRRDNSFMTAGYKPARASSPGASMAGWKDRPTMSKCCATDGSSERYAFASGISVDTDDVIRIHTGAGGGCRRSEEARPRGHRRGHPQRLHHRRSGRADIYGYST